MEQDRKIKNKIAITGANGFLGSNLYNLFDKKDLKIKRLSKSYKNRKYNKYFFDLNEPLLDEKILIDVLCLIHCAATVHKKNIPYKEFKKLDFHGTKKLLEQADNANVKHFIFISSVGVYGLHSSKNIVSEKSDTNPKTPYAKVKLETEKEIIRFCNKSKIKYTIIRVPILFGYNTKGNFSFLNKIANLNIPLPFKFNNNRRTMVYIENLTSFILYVHLNKKYFINETILFTDNINLSVEQCIKNIRKINKKREMLFYIPKSMIWFVLNILGQKKIFYQLYENLEFEPSKKIIDSGWKAEFDEDKAFYNTYKRK